MIVLQVHMRDLTPYINPTSFFIESLSSFGVFFNYTISTRADTRKSKIKNHLDAVRLELLLVLDMLQCQKRMLPSKLWIIAFLAFGPPLTRAGDGADFTNNLLTDMAPLVSLP